MLKLATHDSVNTRKVLRSRCLARRSQKYFRGIWPSCFSSFFIRDSDDDGDVFMDFVDNGGKRIVGSYHEHDVIPPFIRKILSFLRFGFEKRVEKITWYCFVLFLFFFILAIITFLSLSLPLFF